MKQPLILLAALAASTFAWDGDRQGFLLGVGAGAASYAVANDAAEDSTDATMTQGMLPATTFRIGYAWSPQMAAELYTNSWANNMSYAGLNFHYWSSPDVETNAWFGGIGLFSNGDGRTYKDVDPYPTTYGLGLNFGYGRELVAHGSMELNLAIGFLSYKTYTLNGSSWEEVDNVDAVNTTFAAFTISMNVLGY